MIVYYTIMKLIGWIAPGLGSLIEETGAFGSLTGHASGGWTSDAPTNKVTGVVHGQEFVVKAGPATTYRDFLEAMNAGQMPALASPAGMQGTSSYVDQVSASGGVTFAGGGSSEPPVINITNTTGQPVSQRQSTGPDGRSFTDIVIGIAATDVAKGGPLGQAIQSTFGASRQGVRRS